MKNINFTIGENIKNIRKLKNLTTTDLASLAGTSQSTISQIENGRSTNIETLIHICRALKITLFEILPVDMIPLKQDQPERNYILEVLEKMNVHELEEVQKILTANILPLLKVILPIVSAVDDLGDDKKTILRSIIHKIIDEDAESQIS